MEGFILSAPSSLNVSDLCQLVRSSLDDDKADDIVTIDLTGKCSFADVMIVASGRSQRHVGSLASKLEDKLREHGANLISVEGTESCEWVLMDLGDVIVHLFRPETREFYNIEKMWSIPAALLQEEVFA